MKLDIFYYENPRGGVAVSVDDGEHLVIPSGRVLLAEDTVWDEVSSDLESKLTAAQAEVLRQAREDFAAMGDIDLMVEAFRRRRLSEEQRNPVYKAPGKHRQLPESALVVMSEPDGQQVGSTTQG